MIKTFLSWVFLIILNCVGLGVLAQQTDHQTIRWTEQRTSQFGTVPSFENAVYDYLQPDVLKFCQVKRVNTRGEYEVELSNVSYVAVTAAEQKLLADEQLTANPEVEIGFGEHQGIYEVSYCVAPYVKQGGVIRKIVSFDARIIPASGAKSKTFTTQNFKTSSVLANGSWFKFKVSNSGVYKLTPTLLTDAGIKLENINVNSIRVVGNGQGILPELNSAPRKDDLLDVPLKVVDANNNGIFDGSDYALFFARGPHTWSYNDQNGFFTHTLNFYRDANFYFVSVDNGAGKRVNSVSANTGAATATVSTYDDYQFKEDDLENLVGAGRQWAGDVFDVDLDNNYGFNFPDMVRTVPVKLRIRALGRASTGNTAMRVSYNGLNFMDIDFLPYSNVDGADYVEVADQRKTFVSTADNFSLNLRYDNSANPTGVAWLDFIEVQVRRNLIYRNKFLYFRDVTSVRAGNITEFKIANATAQLELWDVTDINQTFSIQGQLNGTDLLVKVATDSLREFVALRGSDFETPEFVSEVENQNLHGLSPSEMVIVVHPDFLSAAERLATFHLTNENMKVEVVTVDQVYNEFSSGGLDISAIRDFMRMLYNRNNGSSNDLKFLCLMGDASYDYRDRLTNNNNFVPIWLLTAPNNSPSFSLKSSSVSDDYYGCLDPSEGGNLTTSVLDIGIGRVPCGSLGQADIFVDKVVHYATGSKRFGDWRNKILLMADDVDDPSAWEEKFVRISNSLEQAARETSNSFNVEKIYTDAYKQVSTSGSESYPEASKDMFRKIQQGNLVTNYIGHGGEIGLASEKLLQLSDINGWTNYDAMPLFVTITCEFTRFDDPKRVSAGEQLLLNPKGGAISLISTTRVVDVKTASDLNENIFDSLLTRPNNAPKRLGEIIKDAKNGNQLRNNPTRLKFSLFGDPSLRLAIPYYRVQTNEVNGKQVSAGNLDTLQALSKVTIKGQVNDLSDQKLADFSGVLNVSVFDKPVDRKTLRNDGAGSAIPFKLQNSLIYKGKVNVVNGDFSIE
ncbi:MAG: type IX secretion system sortase PorU, partial [Owenweeksia sp.]